MKVDFRIIEEALLDALRAEGLTVERIKGDVFLAIPDLEDEDNVYRTEYYSLTAVAERIARELEDLK